MYRAKNTPHQTEAQTGGTDREMDDQTDGRMDERMERENRIRPKSFRKIKQNGFILHENYQNIHISEIFL